MTPTLDVNAPPKISYCIPEWLKGEQIRLATARVADRIAPAYEVQPEPIAVVCFGPSLNDTWERVKDFRHVITCSGAHKFMVERGIIPEYHVEVDPRAHKTVLMGPPQPETTYLIASTCHPKLFDHLEGFAVKLWHVFDNEADAKRTLPHGEWALTGGCSVGLRALTIAAFLGFRDLHVFGMDGCEGASGKHAAEHPNQPKSASECEYPPGSGVIYRTTPAMLSAAQGTWHELDQMPGVTATFYGEGLVQAMAKHYTPQPTLIKKAFEKVVGYHKEPLISEEYRRLNAQLHHDNLAYGVGGGKHAPAVLKLCEELKTTAVLDYGSGKGYLAKALPFPIWEYDPAFPEKAHSPRAADIVACCDVLEHIEPDRLQHVLQDLARVTKRCGYFVIHTGPAQKTLPDGRNTHLIQHGKGWWASKLDRWFTLAEIIEKGPELHVFVGPKLKQKGKVA